MCRRWIRPASARARSVNASSCSCDSSTRTRRDATRRCSIAAGYLDQVADQQYCRCCGGSCASPKKSWNTRWCWCAPVSRARVQRHSVPAEYIVPDVFVRRTERGWAVDINPASLPRIRVNQSYAGLIGRSADHAMLRTSCRKRAG